jgi:hypothetical protein
LPAALQRATSKLEACLMIFIQVQQLRIIFDFGVAYDIDTHFNFQIHLTLRSAASTSSFETC